MGRARSKENNIEVSRPCMAGPTYGPAFLKPIRSDTVNRDRKGFGS
jgi:hypothetical protein